MKSITAVVFLACLNIPAAWSQCSGALIDGQCLPPPCTPGSPLPCPNQQQQPQEQTPVQPQAVWADRWGAIAYDDKTGQTGTAESQESKSNADQFALASCANKGSAHCEVLLSFHNQCAAVAAGKDWGYSAGPNREVAEHIAIARCSHGDECKIVYSKCSYAERIR